jgi:hypothetical protein
MTDTELLDLRSVLVLRRRALLDNLCVVVAEKRVVQPGFLGLFANIQTAIAAIDAVLAETITAEGVAS